MPRHNHNAWQVLIDNEKPIRRILYKLDRRKVDEMWTDVVLERIQRIVMLFDPGYPNSEDLPEKERLKNYVCTNIFWYAKKYLARNANLAAKHKHVPLDDNSLSITFDTDNRELVNTLLSKLSKRSAAIIFMRHMQDEGFQEIGEALGLSRGSARLHYAKAIEEAKTYLETRGINAPD